MYIKEFKYNSINSSFTYKLIIFYNIYNQLNIPQEVYKKVLSIILIGLALNKYFNSRFGNFLFKNACKHLYSFFKGLNLEYKNFNK